MVLCFTCFFSVYYLIYLLMVGLGEIVSQLYKWIRIIVDYQTDNVTDKWLTHHGLGMHIVPWIGST